MLQNQKMQFVVTAHFIPYNPYCEVLPLSNCINFSTRYIFSNILLSLSLLVITIVCKKSEE